jgi:hypothetical protein
MEKTKKCRRKPSEPKFKVGDTVKEKDKHGLIFTTPRSQKSVGPFAKPRGKGVIEITSSKINSIGSVNFFYTIKWENGTSSEHAQSRLLPS